MSNETTEYPIIVLDKEEIVREWKESFNLDESLLTEDIIKYIVLDYTDALVEGNDLNAFLVDVMKQTIETHKLGKKTN